MNRHHLYVSALIGAAATAGFAQPSRIESGIQSRIQSKIDNSSTYALPGRVHPLATAANDRGEVEGSFPLPYITMRLAPTAAQQAKLQQLLQDQQNPASPQFRKWLTPEQYADQFGVSASDTAQIVEWLEAQGFTVNPAPRSRTFITFSGTAAQVGAAFGTAIHHYSVKGAMHYANSTDLTVPAALSPLVAGFHGMNDFRLTPRIAKARPQWTNPPESYTNRALAPDDFATIYDITPMYSAGTNGAGEKITIVGQSEIVTGDISTFWNRFGLTSVTLVQTLVPRTQNPLYQAATGDLDESTLDIEWASAVARGATIQFVYSPDVWDSATYAVDNAIGQVLSMSYGQCENMDLIDLSSYRQMAQQANSEGITWLAASGDQGAADCDAGMSQAEAGLAVDIPSSIPEVTAMGGTSLSNLAAYWSTPNSSTEASAKGYIPETAWNETADSLAQGTGIEGTGGGASMYFPQPSWQTSAGVTIPGWRNVPDLSFNASEFGVPYYVYCTRCDYATDGIEYVGGTSAATPTMGGVVAILNQYLNTNGLGNINPTIYGLYQTTPSAFHNNITGNNMVPCAPGSPNCNNGQEGYSITGPGYSSVVGFGSVDVSNLIHAWTSGAPTGPTIVPSLDQNPVYQGNPESCGNSSAWNFQITVAEEGGFATSLTGLSVNGADYSSQLSTIFRTTTSIPARGSISGCLSLSAIAAPANETFTFTGPNWSSALTVPFQGPQTHLVVGGASNAASGQQTFAPGMIMAVYGTGLGTLQELATTIPLPVFMGGFEAYICPAACTSNLSNGYPVPLYYVGPNQVNLQIPYEVTGAADLYLGNPYQNADYYFTISPAAPGIFTLEDGTQTAVPAQALSAGQTGTVYVTGAGVVNPPVGDGYAPVGAEVPKPRQAVTVTVGGVTAPTPYQYVGIPSWSVGVVQINFTIPAGVPLGSQPVVVTVGTTSSMPAYITIQ